MAWAVQLPDARAAACFRPAVGHTDGTLCWAFISSCALHCLFSFFCSPANVSQSSPGPFHGIKVRHAYGAYGSQGSPHLRASLGVLGHEVCWVVGSFDLSELEQLCPNRLDLRDC